MADEQLEFSIAELEEGVPLEAGKEYEITEKESTGKLAFALRDEAGMDPLEDLDFSVESGSGFSASGKTNAQGIYEHPDPVPFGDFLLKVGKAARHIQSGAEDTPPQVVSLSAEEREDPADPGGSDPEPEDPVEETPLVEIMRDGGTQPAPTVLDVGAPTIFQAVSTPQALAGSWEWTADPSSKVELTPVEGAPHRCTVKGLEVTGEGEKVKLKAKLTPSVENVAAAEDEHELTIRKRVAEVFFQRSPGFPSGPDRAIAGLSFRVVAGGQTLQEGTTDDAGKAEVLFAGHDEVTVELVVDGAAVASYTVTLREAELEAVDGLRGQQRRLRMMGYQLGAAGSDGNGVDDSMGARSDRAILQFQVDNELDADGVVGDQTKAKLTDVAGA
ncbi:MAG: peptidoglycan-binding protein [Planctomycetota bacterium]